MPIRRPQKTADYITAETAADNRHEPRRAAACIIRTIRRIRQSQGGRECSEWLESDLVDVQRAAEAIVLGALPPVVSISQATARRRRTIERISTHSLPW